MAGEATFQREWDDFLLRTVENSVSIGQVFQLPDGRAAFADISVAATAGTDVKFKVSGKVTMPKTASMVFLKGGRAYWDHSANAVHWKKVSDRDFYLGTFAADAASNDSSCDVYLNAQPRVDIDMARDGFQSVLVGTAAAGGFGYPQNLGGALVFEISATSEAQKVDALSVDGFAKTANAIVEGVFRVLSDGATGNQDISIGIADGTHASDADTIATSVFIHLDGNSTTINAESDDGTTEVNATDTTTTYTEGTALANRVEFWMDMRDSDDIQIYVNGALVLGSTVFTLNAFSGTLFLLVHVEKSSGAETYKLAVDRLTARFSEQ